MADNLNPTLDESDDADDVFAAQNIRARLNADPDHPVRNFKKALAWGEERLRGLFEEGRAAVSLVRARTHLVDEVLRAAWSQHIPAETTGLSLAAVGGYGRSELLPASDIDILILHSDAGLGPHQKALERLTAFFWDIGLELGSSVRALSECAGEAKKDITVVTNLMEARFLVGDEALCNQMLDSLTPDKLWPVDEFFRAKMEEQAARYKKYDDTGYKLEPNVKESPGGLRDIHTVGWVAKRHFGASTLVELRDHGFLTKNECDQLFAGQDFLWRVRFALHMLTGRHEDRLLFDHQIKVAEMFGYVDGEASGNRAVEQFMQLYYRTIKTLSCLNDMLLQLFEEAILHRNIVAQVKVINSRFQVRNRYIEARYDDVFREQPRALIELFLLIQKNPEIEGARAQTLRMILRDVKLLNADVREDRRSRTLFISMFREGRGLTRNLRRMNRYGVLGSYLPMFGKVVGLMQYDLFHTLTVDEHTLYVVRNLRRFAMPRFKDELPFCNQLMAEVEKPSLLYLAGFFHDIGKGRGGDHSELGASDAIDFCLRHGCSQSDADLVAWLVRNHLTMSLTAQRADISDPEVIADFTAKVGNRTRLVHLFLLTVADIRATNPALWNSWRESLLKELYKSTERSLERGAENPLRENEMVDETQRDAAGLLADRGFDHGSANNVWSRFGAEYFLRHSPEELAQHFPAIESVEESDLPVVRAENVPGRGTGVLVYMRDRDHLFGISAGTLAKMGLTVLDARINTTDDGYVLDTFMVTESDGSTLAERHRLEEIQERLRNVLSDPQVTSITVNRRIPRRLQHFNTPTTVYFSQDKKRSRTIIELVTADQPGLLSMVGRVFNRARLLIDAAKIATIGERAEDVFFVTDRNHQPITDPAKLQRLRDMLIHSLDGSENQ